MAGNTGGQVAEGGVELVGVDVHQFQRADSLPGCLLFGDAVVGGTVVVAELAQRLRMDGLFLGGLVKGEGEPQGVKRGSPAVSGLLPDRLQQRLDLLVLQRDDGNDVVGCGPQKRSPVTARTGRAGVRFLRAPGGTERVLGRA